MLQLTIPSYSKMCFALKILFTLLLLLLLSPLLNAFPEKWLDPANREALIQSMDAASLEYSNATAVRFERVKASCYKSARKQSLNAFFGKVVILPGTKSIIQKGGVPMPHFVSWRTNETVYISGDASSWNLATFETFTKNVVHGVFAHLSRDEPIMNPKISENLEFYRSSIAPQPNNSCPDCTRIIFNKYGAPNSSLSIWPFDLTIMLLVAGAVLATNDLIRGKKLTDRILRRFNGTAKLRHFVHSGKNGRLFYAGTIWLYGKIPIDRPFATIINFEPACEGLLPLQSHLRWDQDNCYMIAARPTHDPVTKGNRIISAICMDPPPLHISQLKICADNIAFKKRVQLVNARRMFERTA